MSLEDLDSDLQSDDSDYDNEAGKKLSVVEDDDEANYMELVCLHYNLMYFQHIYMNNIEIDLEVRIQVNYILTVFFQIIP